MHDAEVLVVGAGPAGAATAFFLARAGVAVTVLDRARFPRDKPCSEYLSPQASRLLDEMQVLEAIEHAGAAQLIGMTVRAPNGAVMRGEFAAPHGWRGFRDRGLAIRRTVLDALLLDRARAAGATVIEGVRVSDLVANDGRVVGVRADGGREWRAPLVVGADGLRSVVSRRLGLARTGAWPRRIALVTHYRGVSGVGGCGEMHVSRGGYCGLADVGHGETNVAVVIPAARSREIAGDPQRFVADWIARSAHLAPRFQDAERSSSVRATGPFAATVTRAWAPGAALVGDAADFFDPFTGEGIYTALRGAELLLPYAVQAMRAPNARESNIALAAYDRCRRHEFGGKRLVERLIGAAVAVPALINRAARVLARRRDLADLLVGVTGDFVPAREVLRTRFVCALLLPSLVAGGSLTRGPFREPPVADAR